MVCWKSLFCSRRRHSYQIKNCLSLKGSATKKCYAKQKSKSIVSWNKSVEDSSRKAIPPSLFSTSTQEFGKFQELKFFSHMEKLSEISGLQASVVAGTHIDKSMNQIYTLLSFRFWNDGDYLIELIKLEVKMKDQIVQCCTTLERNCPFILHSSNKVGQQIPPGVHLRTFSRVRLTCKVAESPTITEFAKNNTFIQELPETADLELEYTVIFKTWENWQQCIQFASQQSLFNAFCTNLSISTSADSVPEFSECENKSFKIIEDSRRDHKEAAEPDDEPEC